MHLKTTLLLPVILMIIYVTGYAQPVETKAPNSNYKPAFSGQTRIAGVKTSTPYKVEKIANNLGAPFAIVAMPDGRLMVTIKSGYAEIHDANGRPGLKRSLVFPMWCMPGKGGC